MADIFDQINTIRKGGDIFDLIDQASSRFDPEGGEYDYEGAKRAGIEPDETGHWASRDPNTGLLLKGRGHPTWHKTVEAEERLGYQIVKRGGRYYSVAKQAKPITVFEQLKESTGRLEEVAKAGRTLGEQQTPERPPVRSAVFEHPLAKLRHGKKTPEQVEEMARFPDEYRDAALRDTVRRIYRQPGPEEAKKVEADTVVRAFVSAEAGRLQAAIQTNADRQRWIDDAKSLQGKFLAKSYRRWERGSALVVGGGLHLAEELARLATLGRKGETLGEWAEIYHDVLNTPEMQPVIENAWDRYLGGAVEMAPFLATTLIPGLSTRAVAAIPTSIGPLLTGAFRALTPAANFLTAYGVESNLVYQGLKDQGRTEIDARVRGVLTGLINAGIELRGGSGEKYFQREAIDAATRKLGRFKYFSRKALRTALAEGLAEEVPQEAVSMILGNTVPRREDGKIDWAKAADQMIDVAIMGTLVGGLVASPIAAVEASRLPSFTEGEVISVSPEALSIPGRTYMEARVRADSEHGGKNPWIKQEQTKTNKDRVLLIQFASDLLTEGKEDPQAKAYYDKLFVKRPGYVRLGDVWEVPKWIAEAANFVPGADVYFVRDMAEAKQFLKSSGYEKVMFSALDINTPFIQELAKDYKGRVVIGGYVGKKAIMPESRKFAKHGTEYFYRSTQPGVNAQVNFDFDGGDAVDVYQLNVDAELQGRGIGSKTLSDIKDVAASSGKSVTLLALAPDSKNQTRLESFYQRHGFRTTGKATGRGVYMQWDPPETTGPFAGMANVTWYDSMPGMAKGEGYEYKAGVNLSHFEGSPVVPRLCLSKGCKHKCAFCVVTKNFEETPRELAEQQIDAMAGLDVRLVYLDDKTFGQAKNHTILPELYWRMKEKNPEFEGFIIQTTASQFGRFSDEFVTEAHIRYVEFGVESYNDAVLAELHKPHNEARIDEAMTKARRLKINVIPNIIIGLPQETAETYARTLDYLERNADVISHVNAYNLALYEGTEIAEKTTGGEVKDEDLNENAVAKSFHKDPQLHADFAQRVYEFGSRMLDHSPVGRGGLTTDQAIAQQYGIEPGRVEILLHQAEQRYRELKAKPVEERKGKQSRLRVVTKTTEPEPLKRNPRLSAILPGMKKSVVSLATHELEARAKTASKYRALYVEELANRRKERERRPVKVKEQVVVAATGEHAELAFLSRSRNDIEAILADLTSKEPVLSLKLRDEGVPTTRPEAELLERGHGIAQQLGMTEEERRFLMVDLTGRNSMKAMTPGEMEQYVQYLEMALKDQGMTYEPKPASYYEMLDLLQNGQRPERIENARTVRDTLGNLRDGLQQVNWEFTRLDRFFEWLDGADADGNGWFKRTFYRPVVQANAARNAAIDADVYVLDDMMKSLGVNPGEMLSKVDKISDRLEMTAFDRIGVFMLWMNEKGRAWLEQMGVTEQDVADIYAFMGGDGSKEVQIAEYMFSYYESFWPVIQRVAISVGVDEEELQQEFLYSPIMLKDRPIEDQVSLVDYFEEAVFEKPGTRPEQRFMEKRVGPGRGGRIETNALVLFFSMANRLNTFKEMAPVAYSLSKMLSDPQFGHALNRATNDMGVDLVNRWLKHAVRGHGDRVNNVLLRGALALRNSGIFYSIGFNIPSVMRQIVGTFNTLSKTPKLIPHFLRTCVQSMTGGYKEIAQKVVNRSEFVRHRSLEEVLRKRWTKEELVRRYGRKNADLSTLSMTMLHASDLRSVTLAWWSLYQMELKQGANEQEAIVSADEWTAKTQEAGDAVYLPDVMRNGAVAVGYKLLFPFTNQINNQLNQYMYDNWTPIKQHGLRAGGPLTAYRFLMSWVIPALLFGMIERGRPQKDLKETAVDLLEYPVAPLLMLGDYVMYAVTGESKRGELYEMGFQSAADTVRSAMRGDIRGVVKNAARSVGIIGGALNPRLRGAVTAQTIRSIEAAYDLAFSENKPPAYSLVVGEYAAQKAQTGRKTGEDSGRIRR